MYNQRFKALILPILVTMLIAGGCAIKRKQVETPPDAGKASMADLDKSEERPGDTGTTELTPEERRRIEAEELENRRRLAREKAMQELKDFRPEDIFFEFDRSDLSASARETVGKLATWLANMPLISLSIEGHADERGTSEYNLALGDKRASSVMRYLLNLGIDGKRLTTVSYGEEMPLESGSSEDAWAKNRRVHFEIR